MEDKSKREALVIGAMFALLIHDGHGDTKKQLKVAQAIADQVQAHLDDASEPDDAPADAPAPAPAPVAPGA